MKAFSTGWKFYLIKFSLETKILLAKWPKSPEVRSSFCNHDNQKKLFGFSQVVFTFMIVFYDSVEMSIFLILGHASCETQETICSRTPYLDHHY